MRAARHKSRLPRTAIRVSQIEHGQADRTAVQGLASYVAALGGRLELVADFGDERIVIG
jgi:hypothetical protein